MMARTLAFMVVRQVLGLVGLGSSPDQLLVLRRQVARPRYTPTDRMVLAALAKLLPRDRWPIFRALPAPITDPDTIAHLNVHRHDRLGRLLHEYEHAA